MKVLALFSFFALALASPVAELIHRSAPPYPYCTKLAYELLDLALKLYPKATSFCSSFITVTTVSSTSE
jgi:hypothetical protein